jgi:hypothetical protein
MALVEPVSVTRNGRERVIILSAEEYHRLKRRDRQVLSLDDFTPEDIQAILASEPPQEANAFNAEMIG